MIKAVIFDMDGLMFDTESAYSVVQTEMSRKRSKEFTLEIKNTLMGKRAHEVMELLDKYWGKNESIEELLKEQDEALVLLYKNSVTTLEGLGDLLAFLKSKGIRKCIGTSSRKFLVDVLLEKFNLQDKFEFVVSGDMVSRGKPDPEIYQLCLSKLALLPDECLVLEDSLNGVKAGKAAGCYVAAIPSEYTKHEDFSVADVCVKNLTELISTDFLLGR